MVSLFQWSVCKFGPSGFDKFTSTNLVLRVMIAESPTPKAHLRAHTLSPQVKLATLRRYLRELLVCGPSGCKHVRGGTLLSCGEVLIFILLTVPVKARATCYTWAKRNHSQKYVEKFGWSLKSAAENHRLVVWTTAHDLALENLNKYADPVHPAASLLQMVSHVFLGNKPLFSANFAICTWLFERPTETSKTDKIRKPKNPS